MENSLSNQDIKPTPKNTLLMSGVLVFLLLLVLTLYTYMHEGGHALVGLLFGGTITSFNVNFLNLSAHVGIVGDFTQSQHALVSVAGVSLPLLLSLGLILFYSKKREPVFEWFRIILFLGAVNSLLAWIIIPLLVMQGKTVADDSANFLNYSGIQPWVVALLALVIYALAWILFIQANGGLRALINRLRHAPPDFSRAASRQTLLALGLVAALSLTTTIALTQLFPLQSFEAPPGYELVAELHLLNSSYTQQPVYQFSLGEPASTSFYFQLENVRGAPTDISLSGPNGFEKVLFNIQDPKAEILQASVNPRQMQLVNGDYQIIATFQSSPGNVRIFMQVD